MTTTLFFVLLELALLVIGFDPVLVREDPYVGFVSSIPLYEERTEPGGPPLMARARNKLSVFNHQQFPRRKPDGTYRIVTLGGSTTYGRPYDDVVSFSNYLRQLLPVADPEHDWEVINAGGISYASYRVAVVMEELARYEPDLFVVYCGHNEFLEERTYRGLRQTPTIALQLAGLLTRTRTFAAVSHAMGRSGGADRHRQRAEQEHRDLLPGEVDAVLDRSVGPSSYRRDDALRENILEHYRLSLHRMVDIARRAGADILFVTPASNLKDSAPFKSQHLDGVEVAEQNRWKRACARGMKSHHEGDRAAALTALNEALAIDGRFAHLHYLRAKVLLDLKRYPQAKAAFELARDEDVCPLRALTPVLRIVAEVAAERDVPLVDFVALLEEQCRAQHGHDILGREYFLDHVHPTIETNRRLAQWIIEALAETGRVQLGDGWNPRRIAEVAEHIEGQLEGTARAQALLNLSKVLSWAGKVEEARRLAADALKKDPTNPECLHHMGRFYEHDKNWPLAFDYYRRALRAVPLNHDVHLQIGQIYAKTGDMEAAAGHFLLATRLSPDMFEAYCLLGQSLIARGQYAEALPQLRACLSKQPKHERARKALAEALAQLGGATAGPRIPPLHLTTYPSIHVETLSQVKPDIPGTPIRHGISTRWYESGTLHELVDYRDGRPVGTAIVWNEDGTRRSESKGAR